MNVFFPVQHDARIILSLLYKVVIDSRVYQLQLQPYSKVGNVRIDPCIKTIFKPSDSGHDFVSVTRDLSTARLLEADCLPEEDDDENGDKDEEDAKNEAGDGDVSCIPPQGARFCEIPFVFCKPRLQKREKVI